VVTMTSAEVSRLRWRSRRGMRELDQLFGRYLELAVRAPERFDLAAFEALLVCEDDALWRWFIGRERPLDPQIASIVDVIVELPPA